MSDGIKAAYEEEEMEHYKKQLDFYSKKTPIQVYNLLSKIEESMHYFINSDPSLTQSQWGRIKDIRKALKVFGEK